MDSVPTLQLCAINLGGVSIWLFALALLCLAGSAFFSASEMAFTTVNQIRLKNLADNKVRGARKSIYIIEHYDKTLASILIGNNLVNIGLTTICAYMFGVWISNPTLSNVLNTVIMTIIVLIFGEILPKTIGKADPMKLALRFSGFLFVIIKVLTPVSFVFLKMQKLATKKTKPETDDPTVTEGELESIIDTMEEEGVIDKSNADIMQGVLELPSKTAYDIMTPRVDVVAINYTDGVKKVQDTFMETMFTRVPVFDETIDKIIGVINQKDFFRAMLSGEKIYIKKIMQEPLFINENMKVDDIIQTMRDSQKHMAIVLDEYGGTCGIVTMEDCIEEMVGEIYDEHDDEIKEFIDKKNDNEYIVDPEMDLKDFFEMLEVEHLPETEHNSVGGFLFELSEALPVEGKEISYVTIDERIVNGEYVSIPVDIKFVLSKVEDNRIKEIIARMIDVGSEKMKEDDKLKAEEKKEE